MSTIKKSFHLTIASGKGGTGKTTIATSIVQCHDGHRQFIDCDVEEPNGHIFLGPAITATRNHLVTVPQIDLEKCNYCGKCRDICRFNAITVFGGTIMTFSDLCHSCLGCFQVCDQKAITKGTREVGIIEQGAAGNIDFVQAKTRIGEAMGVSLIKEIKKMANQVGLVVFDAPPGTSCSFVESISGSDFVILVTEPTLYGLHDLKLAVKVLVDQQIPHGVIINKAGLGNDLVKQWCELNEVHLLFELPFSRVIAEGYAKGHQVIDFVPGLESTLQTLLREIWP